jgi:hypothetical protein
MVIFPYYLLLFPLSHCPVNLRVQDAPAVKGLNESRTELFTRVQNLKKVTLLPLWKIQHLIVFLVQLLKNVKATVVHHVYFWDKPVFRACQCNLLDFSAAIYMISLGGWCQLATMILGVESRVQLNYLLVQWELSSSFMCRSSTWKFSGIWWDSIANIRPPFYRSRIPLSCFMLKHTLW